VAYVGCLSPLAYVTSVYILFRVKRSHFGSTMLTAVCKVETLLCSMFCYHGQVVDMNCDAVVYCMIITLNCVVC